MMQLLRVSQKVQNIFLFMRTPCKCQMKTQTECQQRLNLLQIAVQEQRLLLLVLSAVR